MNALGFDVAVIGGGSAGLAAAVTAAREGANTVLVERHGYLGGMGTASLVHTFCGLYLLRREPDAVLANPGFSSEMARRMIAATGIGPRRMGRVDVLMQHPVEFAALADQVAVEETRLRLKLHTELTGASADASGWTLKISDRGGNGKIHARQLVDASGDAVVAGYLASGSTMAPASRLQRPAYVFAIQGVDAAAEEDRLAWAGSLVEGVRAGRLPAAALGLAFRGSGRPGEWFGTLDLSGEQLGEYDPLDPGCLTALEIEGRATAREVVRWFAERHPSWRGAFISHWPVRAGVRESRRWKGEYVLTGEDLLAGREFDDQIGLATWPMEFRETAKGPKLRFPHEDRPTGIPLRCLKPAGIARLWVAGRCISADHDAHASIRVMGTCFVTGEAAGRAAARAARI